MTGLKPTTTINDARDDRVIFRGMIALMAQSLFELRGVR
jgi:hypothetical protein